jgi:ribonuclease-3 family protein
MSRRAKIRKPKERTKMNDSSKYGSLALAYLGDAVLETLIRERLVLSGVSNTGKLTETARGYVRAGAQSNRVEKLLSVMDEEEEAVYKRARNAKNEFHPKSSTAQEYHRATGFEAVFGWLYLAKKTDRLNELFNLCYPELN